MIFDWDPKKAETNLKIHKVSFEHACLVFEDFFALEQFDEEHSSIDEKRFIRLGLANDKIFFVVYTMEVEDNKIFRLISARPAEKSEEKMYWDQRYEE